MNEPGVFARRPSFKFIAVQIAVVVQIGLGVEGWDNSRSLAVGLHIVAAQDGARYRRNSPGRRAKPNVVQARRTTDRGGFPVGRRIEQKLPRAPQPHAAIVPKIPPVPPRPPPPPP